MQAHRATASSAERLLHCQYWARPDVEHEERQSAEAQAGTAAHAALAQACLRQEDAPAWAVHATRDVPPHAWVEQPVLLNTGSGAGRLLRRGAVPRDYGPVREQELPGTVDVAWTRGSALIVRDWKTGSRAADNLPPPEESPQLGVLALALCRALARARQPREIVLLQYALVTPENGNPEIWEAEVPPHALQERWLPPLRRALRRVRTAAPNPGAHCLYCPAGPQCPSATWSLAVLAIAELGKSAADVSQLDTVIRSPEHASRIHTYLGLAQDRLDQIRAALRRYVQEHGPVQLDDARELRLVETTRETCALSRVPAELVDELRKSGAVTVTLSAQLRVCRRQSKEPP